MAIALWDIQQCADWIGVKTTGGARSTLSRWGIQAAEYRRGENGRTIALYRTREVREAARQRLGRGHRSDLRDPDAVYTVAPGVEIRISTEVSLNGREAVGEAIDGVWEAALNVDGKPVARDRRLNAIGAVTHEQMSGHYAKWLLCRMPGQPSVGEPWRTDLEAYASRVL